tara:strand:- start:1487 stop:2725 length:1239 start_codon:yes stop_codon:yes gene_type:complete
MVLKSELTLKNSLSKISFCDKECYNINHNKTKEAILNYIQETYKIQVIDRQYVNLNPHMMRNISNNEHIVSTFTNGNPYLLYLIRIDDTPCCIYIDRKLKNGYSYPKMHCVPYKFDSQLFDKETIFTGELVRDVNRDWQFLISDLLLLNGESTKTKNILARFQNINTLLENHYTPDRDNDICPIYSKRLFQYHDIPYLFNDYLPKLSYVCKGLVFYTLNNQFSNYAWILPREDQLQVKRKDEMDEDFYASNPDYKPIGFICQDFNNKVNDFQSRFTKSSFSSEGDIKNNNNTVSKTSKIEENTITISNDEVILKILKTDIPDIYNLYSSKEENTKNDESGNNKVGIAFIPNLSTSQMLYQYFKDNPTNMDSKVICKFHPYFQRWIPIKITNNKNSKEYTSSQIKKIIAKIPV